MRIEKIRFKNINSLKGAHEVDFSQPPLYNAGIFAILGPTGAGKSTLLDVITLALFNRIPRFPKLLSNNEIEGNGSVMTHFTDDAYAIIDYTIGNNTYISEWKVEKNRNGKLKAHSMRIYDTLTAQDIDLKNSEVPTKNAELIGLNYDQFSKSIILSQGQFSKFLKAGKDERGLLLEKITGTEIYRKIGAKVYEKYKSIHEIVTDQQKHLELISILEENEKTNIEQEIITNKAEVKKIEQSNTLLNGTIQIKRQISKLQKQLIQENQSLEKLFQSKSQIENKLTKLKQYDRIRPLVADTALYLDACMQKASLQKQQQESTLALKNTEQALDKVLNDMSRLVQSTVRPDDFIHKMQSFEKEINELSSKRASKKEEGIYLKNKIIKKYDSVPYPVASTLKNERNINQTLQQIADQQKILLNYLHAAGLTPDSPTTTVNTDLQSKNRELQILNTVKQHSKSLDTLKKQKQDYSQTIATIEQKKVHAIPQRDTALQKQKQLREHLEKTQQLKEQSQALFNLNDYREKLIDGETCPLCGSTEHPMAGHTEKEHSHFDIEIKKTHSTIVEKDKEIEHLNKTITECEANLATYNEQISQIERHRSETQKWFTDNNEKPQELSKISQQIEQIEEGIKRLMQARASLDEYKWLEDIKEENEHLGILREAYKKLDHSIKIKYEGEDVSTDCNRMQDIYTTTTENLKVQKHALKTTANEYALIDTKAKQLEDILLPQVQKLGLQQIKDINEFILSEEEIQQYKQQKEQYDKKETEFQSKKQTLELEILNLKKQDQLSDQSLENIINKYERDEAIRKELLQKSGAHQKSLELDAENIQKRSEIDAGLQKNKMQRDKWELLNGIIGDATGNKFSRYAQNITLKTLLIHANKRMKNLYNRYLLAMPKADGELVVIDTYQGNTERVVSTLSGGETFMVSLALALSLSDMASKNVALESLFIDEGFSTLDPEMLDLAMSTLDKIQSESQKTVGIISHVESLKERIAVQIHLERNAQGFSSIRIEH